MIKKMITGYERIILREKEMFIYSHILWNKKIMQRQKNTTYVRVAQREI